MDIHRKINPWKDGKFDKRRYRRMLRREARGTYFQLEHTPFHQFTLKLARNFRR